MGGNLILAPEGQGSSVSEIATRSRSTHSIEENDSNPALFYSCADRMTGKSICVYG